MLKILIKNLKQFLHNSSRKYYYDCLRSRSLVEVAGVDFKNLIQGLITNDISTIGISQGSMYGLFLNAKGRVLFDVILYGNPKSVANEQVYIDCDSDVVDLLIKHLNTYKLRKKVKITPVQNPGVFVIMPENNEELLETLKSQKFPNDKLIYFGSDPRIKFWSLRCIGIDQSVESALKHLKPAPDDLYLQSRLTQGLCEGRADFGIGTSLPLEYNGDILNAISFNKGCYMGQELTARTHYTGVVRKRIMPVHFKKSDYSQLSLKLLNAGQESTNLSDKNGVAVGQLKLINECGLGLAVIRLSHLKSVKSREREKSFQPIFFVNTDCEIFVNVPQWWPDDIVLPSD